VSGTKKKIRKKQKGGRTYHLCEKNSSAIRLRKYKDPSTWRFMERGEESDETRLGTKKEKSREKHWADFVQTTGPSLTWKKKHNNVTLYSRKKRRNMLPHLKTIQRG